MCNFSFIVVTLEGYFKFLRKDLFFCRYNEDLELEDAIHTAILTLKVKDTHLKFDKTFKVDILIFNYLTKLCIFSLLGKF